MKEKKEERKKDKLTRFILIWFHADPESPSKLDGHCPH